LNQSERLRFESDVSSPKKANSTPYTMFRAFISIIEPAQYGARPWRCLLGSTRGLCSRQRGGQNSFDQKQKCRGPLRDRIDATRGLNSVWSLTKPINEHGEIHTPGNTGAFVTVESDNV
jgi:hypothetical protein